MRPRDRGRGPQAELVELGDRGVGLHALGLVHCEVDRRAQPAQLARDLAIARGQPGARVDHEDDRVDYGNRLLGLARHFRVDALLRGGLEAASVDGDEGAAAEPALPVVPVARDARDIVNDRVAAEGQPVEKGRLADVGPADQRDDRLHIVTATSVPSWVWMSRLEGRFTGAARTAPPRLA